MFICQYDANASGNPVTDITTLFNQYAAQNIHTTVAAAWGARFDIPIPDGAGVNLGTVTMLPDSTDVNCPVGTCATAIAGLVSCALIMAFESNNAGAYVCHASGGLSQIMKEKLADRVGNQILLITPTLSTGGAAVDPMYDGIVTTLLQQGHDSGDICLIDGKGALRNAIMAGNGNYKPTF